MNLKYLERQGEPEAKDLAVQLKGKGPWRHFLAIPCCGEDELLPSTLSSLKETQRNGSLLLLLLINEGPDTKDAYKESNRRTLEYLENTFSLKTLSDDKRYFFTSTDDFDIVVINRCGEAQFPRKKGVGLARKICSDVGLALYQKKLTTSPWIHNTDGDAQVPTDYFLQTETLNKNLDSAALYQFQHLSGRSNDSEHWEAATLYESWLRYYRLGLHFAKSPYGFHTVGSTIAINAKHYSIVHGFPRREAGEDFYLLNKLAKAGRVVSLGGEPITLEDRPSARVPFGTGQGTQKIKDQTASGDVYKVYHPHCFTILKTYLAAVVQAIDSQQSFQESLKSYTGLDGIEILEGLTEETDKAIEQARTRAKTTEKTIKQFHDWFDAFRTLKFIHYCRDNKVGTLPIADAVVAAKFLPDMPHVLNGLRAEDRLHNS